MTRDERHERGTRLCQRLVDTVVLEHGHAVVVWAWADADACRLLRGPDVDLVLALATWESAETPATYQGVVDAYGALIHAWRQVGRLYGEREVAR